MEVSRQRPKSSLSNHLSAVLEIRGDDMAPFLGFICTMTIHRSFGSRRLF